LEIESGILDTNSAQRRKVNKIDRPPPIVLIDRHDCPLTTKFAPGITDEAIGRVLRWNHPK
jgi:hypothetical protein